MQNLEKGQHIFIAFQNGKAVLDSQLRPRMYTSLENADRWTPTVNKGKIEYVEYAPTLIPPNDPLTLEQIKSLYDSPAWYQDLYRKMGYWIIVGVIGEIGVHLTDLDNANEFYSTIDYGARWALFRRPPEGEADA